MTRSSLRTALCVAAPLLVPAWLLAQDPATITGTVTREDGAPLSAANVFIESLGVGSATDASGRYTFTVPGGRAAGQQVDLTVRRIGYLVKSTPIVLRPGATITTNFTMSLNPLRLGEVVVTGAGTTTIRERLGNVISSVDSMQIRRANEPNIVQALAGKAPNVVINQQSGEPGASSYIRIRGSKSIQGTQQPLFVVDGVPIDNTTIATGPATASTVAPNRASDINPADIESVEILKGSAAAAIYGARAAQGVVLITTKSGKPGPTRYSLRSTISVDKVSNRIPLQTRFGQGFSGAFTPCTTVNCRATSVSWGPELAAGTPTYDHWEELFDTGLNLDNTLTVSGGNERTTFYLSAGRLDQEGIIVGPNNNYQRTTTRLRASHKLLSDLTVGGNISYIDVSGNFVQKGSNISGLLLGAMRTPPEFDNRRYLDTLSGLHRSYRFPNPGPTSDRVNRGYDNPFFIANEMVSKSELGRALGNVTADYAPMDWLNVNWTLGADYYADWRLEAFPLTSSTYATGQVTRADLINSIIDHSLTATGTHTFTPDFSGSLTLGQNLTSRRYRQAFVVGKDLIAPEPFALQNTSSQDPPTEFRSLVRSESYFAQATAELYDQLFLTAAVRNDGFSTFGASDRRHWFPKASMAWTFTDLLGMDDGQGMLSFGKLRAAYGETGKEPSVYQTIQATLVAGGTFGSGWGDYLNATQGGLGGLYTSGLRGNENIRPERTREVEAGFDLGLFNQMADVGVTYYDSKSTDVILTAPLPPSTGYTAQLENAAQISNSGWEVTTNIRPLMRPNATWEIGLQWARNRNNVDDLKGAEFVNKAAGTFAGAYGSVTKGYPVGVIRGEDFVRCGRGLSVGGVNIDNTAGHCQGAPAGALYIGAGGFPLYDETDRVIADPNPDWTGAVRSSLTLMGNMTLSGLVDFKRGGDIWNGTRGALYYFGTHAGTLIRNTQQTFGSNGFYPGAVAGPGAGTAVTIDQGWYTGNIGSGFTGPSSQFIEDGSYAKLREISLAYTFDQPWVSRVAGMSSIDVRIAGRNLYTWTDYTGIDPETNLGGAEVFVQGIDYFNNPQTRSFVLSIGLNK
jgi:TonB-linked SusC/RagA family outer membrane protein